VGGRARGWLFGGLAAAALLILAGRAVAQLYIDFQWYASLDAAPLWWLKAQNVVLLKLASLLVSGAFVFANLYAVRQSVASVVLPRRVGDLEIAEELSARSISRAVAVASLVVAAFLTLPSDRWPSVAAARVGLPFGESDPRFQSDLAFWVYWLPLEQACYARMLATLAVVIGIVALVYALTPNLRWERGQIRVSPHVRRHLSVLSGCVLLVLAWSYRLDAFETLLGERGAGGAWSWVDHNVYVPARIAMAVGAALGGAVVALTGWAGQTRLAFMAATGVLALSLVLGQAVPAVAERATRGADPAERELPYAATRAAYTRRAFGADGMVPADSTLGFATPAEAAAGVPVWDPEPFRLAVERTRRLGALSGRPAIVTGGATPLFVAAERPLPGPTGITGSRAWSVVRTSATAVGARGEIVGSNGGTLVEEDAAAALPAMVHDSARSYLFISDPAGQVASVDVSSAGSRLALALSQQNLRLLRSPPSPARVVLRRDLRERIARLAPFFVQGASVTPAVSRDTLFWSVHLYSASATYPVSRPTPVGAPGLRYLHHAGVAVVNAFSGRVTLVADALPDPIARSWLKALPGSFARWEDVPAEVRRALPPPVEGALAQAAAYAEFGERGEELPLPRSLRIPAGDTTDVGADVPLLLLPIGGGTPAVTLPISDATGRLTGLAIALGGAQPRTAWLALDESPADPSYETVVDRLRRGLDVTATARGERVTAGAERVVPVGGAAAYVMPHYVDRGESAPLLAGVTTYFRGEYRQGTATLAALGEPLLAAGDSTGAAPLAADSAGGLARARSLYDAARAALRAGDWAAFGRAYDALGAALGRDRP
jgi:uncharacterized membrane protein (UPF0182 family)